MTTSADIAQLPWCDDLHVHLRQGAVMATVVPMVRRGGVRRCLVMPNTSPPLTDTATVLRYREALRNIDADVEYLMTLYLSPSLTPGEVRRAAGAGIVGVKCYPQGVTTNSASGVEDLDAYVPVFAAMQDTGMVLELHGEVPRNDAAPDVCVLDAEERFLPILRELHSTFPKLRIVLEHVTTAAAVACVQELGDTVAATITAHHLMLTVDDWAGRNHNFCKPVAKYPHDRRALRDAVAGGNPKFFLGSDSAPHPVEAKEAACACAGVFTSPLLLAYIADAFDRIGCLEQLEPFCGRAGAAFYGLPPLDGTVTLRRTPTVVPDRFGDVVPFRAGETLAWSLDE